MLLGFPTRLDLPAVGEQGFFAVSPDMLHRLEMVSLQSGMRIDRFARFGTAVRVIREGRGHLEAAVFASLETWPGIFTMLRHRCMGHEDAVMLILHHHHTMVGTQRVGAVNRTLRRWGAGTQWPKPRLWRGHMRANVIHPALERRLAKGNQEQRGKEESNVPETDSTDHRERAGHPEHAVAHRLGGRATLDGRCEGYPRLLGIERGTLG